MSALGSMKCICNSKEQVIVTTIYKKENTECWVHSLVVRNCCEVTRKALCANAHYKQNPA